MSRKLMDPLLSAKGVDITSWRAAQDFTAEYREALLDRAVYGDGGAETVFSDTYGALETAITTHKNLLRHLNSLIGEVAAAVPSTDLKELTTLFYKDLYRHFGHFRSTPAFYQLSMNFLRQMSSAIIVQATDQIGLSADQLPEMALIAVGPAGRCEYSPFCPLQILLVHGEAAASQLKIINLFCETLHAGFEAAGLAVDQVVTPRNIRWRGTMADWQQRCEERLHPQTDEELIDLCRLVDQYPLHPVEGLAHELKQISSATLSGRRSALTNLIERITSLSNGLGIMGRLKLDHSGSERGLFRLLDHGLLPFSAALSALALLKKSQEASNPERIRDLLKRGELDVELAERMLATWHALHELRLRREQSFHIDHHTKPSLFLNPIEMTFDERQMLKKTLESVAIIQQHVEIVFSGMGE